MKTFILLIVGLLLLNESVCQVHVSGYYRKNGTYVAPHYRSSPNSTKSDNYSTKGNYNPYTGKPGTKTDNSSNSSYPSNTGTSYSPIGYTPAHSSNDNSNSAYKDWSSYIIDDFFTKEELPYGTLDNSGNRISYIYKKVDSPKIGEYEISISEADGDVFEIKGTEWYVVFRNNHGYAGYSEDGVLEVRSDYSVYYKKP